MGYFNVIWQADANAMALAALEHTSTPPLMVNIAGPEELSVRAVSAELARRQDLGVSFINREVEDALLINGSPGASLFGEPRVDVDQLLALTSDGLRRGAETVAEPAPFGRCDRRL